MDALVSSYTNLSRKMPKTTQLLRGKKTTQLLKIECDLKDTLIARFSTEDIGIDYNDPIFRTAHVEHMFTKIFFVTQWFLTFSIDKI